MAVDAYAQPSDLLKHGLPPAVLVAQPRALEAVDATANTLTLSGHGLDLDAPFQFVNIGGALPAPLSASAVYYGKPVPDSDSLFQVSAAPGGVAVDLTNAGTGVTAIVVSTKPRVDAALRFRARHIDQHLVAHSVPLTTWTEDVTAYNAQMAAADLILTLGAGNAQYKDSLDALTTRAAAVQRQLDVFARGVPLRGLVVDKTPGEADAGAVSWGDEDRGWDEVLDGRSVL